MAMPIKELLVIAAIVWFGICAVSIPNWSVDADRAKLDQQNRRYVRAAQEAHRIARRVGQ